jgi:hypothetical protein
MSRSGVAMISLILLHRFTVFFSMHLIKMDHRIHLIYILDISCTLFCSKEFVFETILTWVGKVLLNRKPLWDNDFAQSSLATVSILYRFPLFLEIS